MKVTADVEARGSLTTTAAFQVLPEHRVPAPGDHALKTENLTLMTKDAPRMAVDSRWSQGKKLPDPELHRSTVASSI